MRGGGEYVAGNVLLRFPKASGAKSDLLKQWTGYDFQEDGDSFVVRQTDPIVLRGPKKVLTTEHDAWTLNPKTYNKIARDYIANYLIEDFEKKLEIPKEPVQLVNAGVVSDLESVQLRAFFCLREALQGMLTNDVLPFMQKFGATRVFPLKIDFLYQGHAISIMKIALFNTKYGMEESKRRVLEGNALRSLLPTPTDIISYVEILNTYAPRAITIPLPRMGSVLHFLGDKAWTFPYYLTRGVYENLISRDHPLAERAVPPIFNREHFIRYVSRRYFRATVEAVNRLTQFLNDPRSYSDGHNEADLELFVKVHSLVRLVFADLSSLHLSGELHQRHRFAFSFFDKMANLHLAFGSRRSEGELFKQYLSPAHGEVIAEILRKHLDDDFAPIGRVFERLCRDTYKDIEEKLGTVSRKSGHAPQEILRTLRNLQHGTVLSSGVPFDELFFHADVEVPQGVLYLPLLFMLAFCFEPKRTLGIS
jgi:hypothetical protein